MITVCYQRLFFPCIFSENAICVLTLIGQLGFYKKCYNFRSTMLNSHSPSAKRRYLVWAKRFFYAKTFFAIQPLFMGLMDHYFGIMKIKVCILIVTE